MAILVCKTWRTTALVIVHIRQFINKKRTAGGAIGTVVVLTANQLHRAVFTSIFDTAIHRWTFAIVIGDAIHTSGAIVARTVNMALVDFCFTMGATVTRNTLAAVAIDCIDTTAMYTRPRCTLINVCLTMHTYNSVHTYTET